MSKPRVMIDGFNLALDKGTGVATYGRNLSRRLRHLGHEIDILYGLRMAKDVDDLLAEISFYNQQARGDSTVATIRRLVQTRLAGRLPGRNVPMTGKVIGESFAERLPEFDRIYNIPGLYQFCHWYLRVWGSFAPASYEGRADIAHWTYPVPVELKGARNIYTIHDLVPLRLPYTTLDNKRDFLKILRQVARRADHIVTVSEASKRDIIELLGVEEDRVTNTYQSSSTPAKLAERSDAAVASDVEALFGLPYKGYFLFYGAIEPKKNVPRIIEAYLASRVETPLVIVGQPAWKNGTELRILETYNATVKGVMDMTGRPEAKRNIIQFDYMSFPMLISLIRGAKSVVFPSLYEGFGLPILEAMQLGTAVITSNQGSNPEVAGDAAPTVDPYDVEAIAGAFRMMDADADYRTHCEARGREQARRFSAEAYDARLAALYAKLA